MTVETIKSYYDSRIPSLLFILIPTGRRISICSYEIGTGLTVSLHKETDTQAMGLTFPQFYRHKFRCKRRAKRIIDKLAKLNNWINMDEKLKQ